MTGLHGAVLKLFMLHGHDHGNRHWSFQPLASMHALPSSFCPPEDGDAETDDVPGSMLLLAGASSVYPLSVSLLHSAATTLTPVGRALSESDCAVSLARVYTYVLGLETAMMALKAKSGILANHGKSCT